MLRRCVPESLLRDITVSCWEITLRFSMPQTGNKTANSTKKSNAIERFIFQRYREKNTPGQEQKANNVDTATVLDTAFVVEEECLHRYHKHNSANMKYIPKYPSKRPQTVWGGTRIYGTIIVMMTMMMMVMMMVMRRRR